MTDKERVANLLGWHGIEATFSAKSISDNILNLLLSEREACAKVAEEYADDFKILSMSIAHAIRERGK